MNEKMNERYEWSAECPMTRRILGYIREAGEDAKLARISQMVTDDMISKIEVTGLTAPFVVFSLRDLAGTIEACLDEDGIATLRMLEAVIKPVGVTMRVPFTLESDGDKDESEKK